MCLGALRSFYEVGPTTTIVPLEKGGFGLSLRDGDPISGFHASAVMHSGIGLREIIVAGSIEAILHYADLHRGIKIDQFRKW